jgi:hypothetical protein
LPPNFMVGHGMASLPQWRGKDHDNLKFLTGQRDRAVILHREHEAHD